MALVGEPSHSKRPHVKTEKMAEFIKTQEEHHKNLSCPFDGCTKVLTSYPGLKYHIKRNHGNDDEFVCEKCQRSFKSANGLRYHYSKGKCWRTDSDEEDHGVHMKAGDASVFSREPRKIPPALNLTVPKPNPCELSTLSGMERLTELSTLSGMERLTEFAIFATSPQSPLMQQAPTKPWETPGFPSFVNSEVKVEDSVMAEVEDNHISPTDKNGNYCADSGDAKVTSTCQIQDGDVWSHPWPKPVWHCFIAGTKISIGFVKWETVEDKALEEVIAQKAAGLNSTQLDRYYELRVVEIRKFAKLDNIQNSVVHLYLNSDDINMCAECVIDHPFFVKGKGWCSNDPVLTERHYGIPCSILQRDDVCLPPTYRETTLSEKGFSNLTVMDKSAVYTLSSMALQKSSPKKKTLHSSPTKKRHNKLDLPKPKRPMNAFMLFAKDHREEYTQKYPGKDNRAISVLLGDEWQKMAVDSRHAYSEKAKQIADQQKRIHPDCWKRKK